MTGGIHTMCMVLTLKLLYTENKQLQSKLYEQTYGSALVYKNEKLLSTDFTRNLFLTLFLISKTCCLYSTFSLSSIQSCSSCADYDDLVCFQSIINTPFFPLEVYQTQKYKKRNLFGSVIIVLTIDYVVENKSGKCQQNIQTLYPCSNITQ